LSTTPDDGNEESVAPLPPTEIPFVWATNGTPITSYTEQVFNLDDVPSDLRRSVAPVLLQAEDETLIGLGTRFCVGRVDDDHALFVTAAHVMKDIDGGKGFVALPSSVGANSATDFRCCFIERSTLFSKANDISLMVVAIDEEADRPLSFRVDVGRPTVDGQCAAIGYPELEPGERLGSDAQAFKFGPTTSRGVIEEVFPKPRGGRTDFPSFQVGAHFPGGMSGGPVLSELGTVIGVTATGWDLASLGLAPVSYPALTGAMTQLRLALSVKGAPLQEFSVPEMVSRGWIVSAGSTCRLIPHGDEGLEILWPPYDG